MFQTTVENACSPYAKKTVGRKEISDLTVARVKAFVEDKELGKVGIREIAASLQHCEPYLQHCVDSAKKRLHWYPYKGKKTNVLTVAHKQARKAFCEWLLSLPEDFADHVIWSDEKWFHLREGPNRQNERFWAPSDRKVLLPCREQGGEKVMCWAAVFRGRVMVHWFDRNQTVNGDKYLNMLKEFMWPQVCDQNDLWFQQDGAPPHMPARK